MDKLNINQWAEADRPREKLLAHGAESLTDAELLAILIGSGSPKENAVALMSRVLSECGNNLNTLGRRTIGELMSYNGIGEAKAVTIIAACELGRRRAFATPEERPTLGSANAIYNYLRPMMGELPYEEAWLLLMNHNFNLLKHVRLSHGGLTETAIDVRVVMKEALLCNATVVALAHNHPSGSTYPSRDDDRITDSVAQACQLMRIYLLDHVIVTDGAYYSYHESGKL